MKIRLLIFVFLLQAFASFAQFRVRGIVTDSIGAPVDHLYPKFYSKKLLHRWKS